MGKGDMKTRRGKLFTGSFGVLRPRKRKRTFSVVASTKKVPSSSEIAKSEKPKHQVTEVEVPKAETPLPEAKETVIEQAGATPVEEPGKEEQTPKTAQEKKPSAKKPAEKKPAAKKPRAEDQTD